LKKILFSTATGLLVLLAACNDSGSSSTTVKADSPPPASLTETTADKQEMKKVLPMSASQEVPANNSTATGSADVSYNKSSHLLTYTITYSGLTGAATMAHIHGTAPKGTNAGVKHDLTGPLQKATSGKFTDSVMVDGTALNQDSLLAGLYYFNIHTPANPGGEIRTQIEF
jgi:hypothetical protein